MFFDFCQKNRLRILKKYNKPINISRETIMQYESDGEGRY